MRRTSGFTVIELIMIITVLAILAALVAFGYSTWQKRINTNVITHELTQAKSVMRNQLTFTNAYPSTTDSLLKLYSPSNDITLELSTSSNLPVYTGLSTVQNGVLFHTICGDLVSDGYGVGANQGGQTEQYISACNVYNNNQIQINSAWHGRSMNTPVQSTALGAIADSINYNDPWRPNEAKIEKDFYNTWNQRFLSQGGSYPVTTFWDPWAAQNNGGTPRQDLPAPTTTATIDPLNYCLQAISKKDTTIVMRITPNSGVVAGPC